MGIVEEAMKRADEEEYTPPPTPPKYTPLRCKIGLHHWHYVYSNEYNHILRCALCGEKKIVGHTIGVIEFHKWTMEGNDA